MSAPACSSNDLDDLFGGPENFAATIKDSQRAIANTIEPAPQTHLKANDPFYLQPKAEITNASFTCTP